jgi:hypothetical protein
MRLAKSASDFATVVLRPVWRYRGRRFAHGLATMMMMWIAGDYAEEVTFELRGVMAAHAQYVDSKTTGFELAGSKGS